MKSGPGNFGRFMSLFRRARPNPPAPDALSQDIALYAVGDVHGCFDLLMQLYDAIKKDLEELRPERSTEIFLGDYIDRGPDSRKVVDWLIDAPPESDKRICLMGNHEAVLLDYLGNPQVADYWSKFGSSETFVSYGVTPPSLTTRAAMESTHQEFLAALPDSHKNFFETLPQSAEIGGYFFAHAGVNPSKPLKQQSGEDLLWIREPFLSSKKRLGRTIVHGHTPCHEPEIRENRINIDTGAYKSGTLSCVRLHKGSIAIINSTH